MITTLRELQPGDLDRRLDRLMRLERDLHARVDLQAAALRGFGPWPGNPVVHKRLSLFLHDVRKRIKAVREEIARRPLNDPSTVPARTSAGGNR